MQFILFNNALFHDEVNDVDDWIVKTIIDYKLLHFHAET
jgi:hypothetical protein